MRLSENIKRFRLKKDLTQEQLAVKLGVSAQAVSKWETSDTYPDGALLLPLAGELGVSLDELFGSDAVSMPDLSRRILSLIRGAEPKSRFPLSRDICWQLERALFNCRMEIDEGYDPSELKNLRNVSYISLDEGFTMVSNGAEPFFALFPQPENGFGHFLNDKDALLGIFAALSHEDTVNALIWLYRKTENYVFESAVLARECSIGEDRIDCVMEELSLLRVVRKQELTVNDRQRILFRSRPTHILIALFLIARELGYRGAYTLQSDGRNTPFLPA